MTKLIETKEMNKLINFQDGFGKHVVSKNAIADTKYNETAEMKNKMQASKDSITAIDPQSNIELLLASQMMSVHNFQQRMLGYAINASLPETSVKYGNLVAKLSNVFIQQVNLMQRLKGGGEQKVVFEHVHIHSGGKAVVGTVNTNSPPTTPTGNK
jgi:hypothetical protein